MDEKNQVSGDRRGVYQNQRRAGAERGRRERPRGVNIVLGAWALLLLLFGVGAAVELARVLNSDEQITMRLIVSRMLAGAVTAVLALLAKFKHPDIEDLAVVGLGAAVAVVGYTALQPALKKLLKALSRVNLSDDGGRKDDD
ncbi:TPA: hypothetical protein MG505_13795 [Klebsiella pneumoniae]|nr:hypothetical protein [Klebsiella pneumoniae]